MIEFNATISIITLIVDGLNTPIKRKILSDWIKKQDPPNYMLIWILESKSHFKCQDPDRLKVKEWKNYTYKQIV